MMLTSTGSPSPATTRFVEQLGLVLEGDGYTRVAGRLFGVLLLTEDTCSLDALAEELAVSKASVSINIRFLEQRGVVERVSRAGDRRDYYRIAPDLLIRTLEQRLARLQRFHDAIAAAEELPATRSKVIRDRLGYLERAYEHMLEITSRALEEWRREHDRRRTPRPHSR